MVCILEFVVCNSSKSLRIWLIIGRNPSKNEALSRLVPLLPYQKISLHHEGFLRNKSFYQRFPSMYVGLFMVCILPFGLYIQGKWSVFSVSYRLYISKPHWPPCLTLIWLTKMLRSCYWTWYEAIAMFWGWQNFSGTGVADRCFWTHDLKLGWSRIPPLKR